MELKNINLYVALLIFMGSCTFLKDKDDLLTSKKWILFSRLTISLTSGESKIKTTYFKKGEAELTLQFFRNGTVLVEEKMGKKSAFARWEWANPKLKIKLITEKGEGSFIISELSENQLKWSKEDSKIEESNYDTFWFFDKEDWDDEIVDKMNITENQ